MTSERRRFHRRPVVLDCSCSRNARVTDLSLGGCYIDAERVPTVGQGAEVNVPLLGEIVRLRGTVTHAKSRVGFGLRFTSMEASAFNLLASAMLAVPDDESIGRYHEPWDIAISDPSL